MDTNTKKEQLDARELKSFISSLKSPTTALLIVDTKRCQHSQRLLEDIQVTTSLGSPAAGKAVVVHVLDLREHGSHTVDTLSWLPGVPCLLVNSNVHLGVDAFTKCREMGRSVEGICIQSLSLLTGPP